ncbi:MAG: hypothetical protein ACRC4X_05370 [Cetobacterium sp.]
MSVDVDVIQDNPALVVSGAPVNYLKQYIAIAKTEQKLPFDMVVEPEPFESPLQLCEGIGTYKLPVYNELLEREVWFFELVDSTQGDRGLDFQIELTAIAKLIKEKFGIKSTQEAFNRLSTLGKNPDSPDFEAEQDFLYDNLEAFNKLNTMGKVADARIANWMKIAFFLQSRVDGNFDWQKITAMRPSVVTQLLTFITKESNGGVLPTVEPIEEDLGNGSNNSESKNDKSEEPIRGVKSTGKSTPVAA